MAFIIRVTSKFAANRHHSHLQAVGGFLTPQSLMARSATAFSGRAQPETIIISSSTLLQPPTNNTHQERNLVITSSRFFSSTKSETSKYETYYAQKKALKELRTQQYKERLARKDVVQRRRDGRPKKTRKKQFESWFNSKRRMESIANSHAKKIGLDWKIHVAVVLERLPVVLPDKPQWEADYDNLRAYLDQFGKDYPEALLGSMEIESLEDLSDEALLGELVRGLTQ